MGNESDEEAELVRKSRLLREEMTEQLQQTLITTVADMIKTSITGLRDEIRQELRQATETDNYYERSRSEHSGSSSSRVSRRQRRDHEVRGLKKEELGGVKLKIPPFHGKVDPDAYLEWEKKIEIVFNCKNYTNTQRIQLAATEFYDYALSWWDQLVTMRRLNQEYPVETWSEMKSLMRKRFVPSHYHRDLHQRLRKLTQGAKTVEEYYQDMELLMLRASISEDREATMSRFLGGLNREIQDKVEMQHYVEIEEMLHKAILVEQQLKRKGHSRGSYGITRFQSPKEDKPNYQKESKPYQKDDTKPSNIYSKDKGKTGASDEKIHTDHEQTEEEFEEEPVKGRLLVTRRLLNLQTKADEIEQRENLFYTRCLVQGKVCSLIIDGGSCVNVASETMVKKLGLQVQKHPKPYRLQWLNEQGEMRVSDQVVVPITIGRYEDEILCDVIPMEASHILLGRPWQSDRHVIHDGFTNKHSFEFRGKKTVLVPLTPKEVQEDQLHLQKKKEIELETDLNKQHSFYAKQGDVKRILYSQNSILLLVFKESLLTTTDHTPDHPSELVSLLREYADVFPEDSSNGLPPVRGIEHQIDFVPGSTLPNRPAYRTNPVETRELQRQVEELMEK
ncbi:uncharacterized protein LOC130503799, partial [Raphanus sativus]|uniref:Uncharacterized protein LOC130503799 n=1 Tax=Raphanus sativus TaxID=3726 RepID=A0A9W3CS68_RAPSA